MTDSLPPASSRPIDRLGSGVSILGSLGLALNSWHSTPANFAAPFLLAVSIGISTITLIRWGFVALGRTESRPWNSTSLALALACSSIAIQPLRDTFVFWSAALSLVWRLTRAVRRRLQRRRNEEHRLLDKQPRPAGRTALVASLLLVTGAIMSFVFLFRFGVPTGLSGSKEAVARQLLGRDLTSVPPDSRARLEEFVRETTGIRADSKSGIRPRRLERYRWGQTHWILMEAWEGMMVPGWSAIRVHQLDAQWNLIRTTAIPTGYRLALFDLRVIERTPLDRPLLAVRVGSIGSVGDFSSRYWQYYALDDARIRFVRLELERGQLRFPSFRARRPRIGPKPPERSSEQWIQSLSSPDPAIVLESLNWLGGRHTGSAETREPNVSQESIEDSKTYEAVRDSDSIRARLKQLRSAKNPWVRAAATQVDLEHM